MQGHGRPALGWTSGTTLLVWMMVVWTPIDLVLLDAGRDHNLWINTVLQAFLFAQFATLAGWLALGDGGVLTRTMCVAVAVSLSELVAQVDAAAHERRQNIGEVAAVTAAILFSLSVPLFVATAFGWRCRRPHEPPIVERPFQFGIAQVLVLTAVVGVLLGLWRVLPERLTGMAVISAAMALVLSPLVAAQWFLQLRPRLGLVWFVALLVVLGSSVVAAVFVRREGPLAMVALALYAAALGVNLALFHGWGYRLLRRNERPNVGV